jgi:hypothetical protein
MPGAEFVNCWLKIGRAEEHFNAFKSELDTWTKSKPYTIVQKRDPIGKRYSLVIENINSTPFDRWSLITGDCVHNLRSALDHSVYALAVQKQGGTPTNERRLQFPITTTPEEFESQKYRIAGLSVKAQGLIEAAQPYHWHHPVLPALLTVLNDFDNSDKHRLLNLTLAHAVDGKIEFDPPLLNPVDIHWLKNSIRNGAEFVYFDMDPPDPNIGYRYSTAFAVTIAHVAGPQGRHVSILQDILAGLIAEVKRVVNSMV